MGSQDVTHNPTFYITLGVQALITLVLVGLVVVGIVIAVRAKDGSCEISVPRSYFEGQNNFYRVFCWSLESKAPAFASDFDKIAGSFREKQSGQ